MILISLQDRITLLRVLTDAIPTVQSKSMRDMLLLMAALIHDYASLEQHTREKLHTLVGLTMDIQKMTADLHKVAKVNGGNIVTTAHKSRLQ